MQPDHDYLLDTTEAATLVGVSPATIRKWKQRGHLTPAQVIRVGRQGRGTPLYAAAEVRDAAAQRGNTPSTTA